MICCAEIATFAKALKYMAWNTSHKKNTIKLTDNIADLFSVLCFKFQTRRVLCVYPHYIYGALYLFGPLIFCFGTIA